MGISISESSPSERSGSIGAPQVSNSSASDASNLTSPDGFSLLCSEINNRLEEIGADLPPNWSIEEFTRLVIGEEEVLYPSYLADVHSNLVECGFLGWEGKLDEKEERGERKITNELRPERKRKMKDLRIAKLSAK